MKINSIKLAWDTSKFVEGWNKAGCFKILVINKIITEVRFIKVFLYFLQLPDK